MNISLSGGLMTLLGGTHDCIVPGPAVLKTANTVTRSLFPARHSIP